MDPAERGRDSQDVPHAANQLSNPNIANLSSAPCAGPSPPAQHGIPAVPGMAKLQLRHTAAVARASEGGMGSHVPGRGHEPMARKKVPRAQTGDAPTPLFASVGPLQPVPSEQQKQQMAKLRLEVACRWSRLVYTCETI